MAGARLRPCQYSLDGTLVTTRSSFYLLDTKPRPVVGYQRDKAAVTLWLRPTIVCAPRCHLKSCGCQWVLLCTPPPTNGAGLDGCVDRGEQVLDWMWQAYILDDKGFLGADGPGVPGHPGPGYPNLSRTAPLTGFERWLHCLQERLESACHKVQNTGRHREPRLCQTVRGLSTHGAAKMTSHAPGACSAVRPGLTTGRSL